uniref:Hemicentin-1-like n=1 Tax=Stegastes partitus TaxID=144197 RepID=A0A3B5BMY4_9TELE
MLPVQKAVTLPDGADINACPEELNPLSLEPPRIVEEYGMEVKVNCTSTFEDHDMIYWRVGNKSFPPVVDEMFVDQSVLLSDWNVGAECKIKLNDSHECSKELEITVYKNPEVISSVKFVQATPEETRYELKCDVVNVAPVQNLTVRFYKNDQLNGTSSFNDTTKTPVNETSVLTFNISTGREEVRIRCEAQLDLGPGGPQLPVISKTYNVSPTFASLDAPELKNDTEDIFLLEDDDVTLTCEAEGNPLPVFHWTYNGVAMLESASSLNITRVNDSATYTCTATNDVGNTSKQFHVHVIKMTDDCPLTMTPSEIVVRFGDPASVNCSTSATDAVGMGWEAPVGGTGFKSPPVVTWNVEQLKDFTVPSCYISLNVLDEHGNTKQCQKSPNVTLYKTPDTVSVSAVHPGPMVEGTDYQLKCDISSVAPAGSLTVKWYRGNETVFADRIVSSIKTPQDVSSKLNITTKREYNGSIFRCKAELQLGPNGPEFPPSETSAPYTAVVHYKPFIKACPSNIARVEHKFSMDKLPCPAEGNPPPTVQWFYEDKQISSSKPLRRSDSGKYTAVVQNSLGSSNFSVQITVECECILWLITYEVEVNAILQTKCEPKGLPVPTLAWFKDGKSMDSSQHWKKHDSGKYLLRATNKHGQGNSTKEVTLGENVTLDCSAEGNPSPVISWKFSSVANVKEATERRQITITVTEATSTTSVFMMLMLLYTEKKRGILYQFMVLYFTCLPDKSSGIPMPVVVGLLIILVIIIILLLLVLLKQQKKKGQYNFVPDSAKDGSSVPMTTISEGVTA